ncbi:MAG: C10 family peptidase [Muribaculaceae bacterium]|nr:C10 family peptidase [Muribaculaceae bacterium]
MKKVILCAFAAIASVSMAVAAPVSLDRAKTTATSFMKVALGSPSVKNVVSQTDSYYIINLNPRGWVIVSADDSSTPILGYSTTGTLTWDNLPPSMRGLLGEYSREIKAIKGLTTKQHRQWKAISSSSMPLRVASRGDESGSVDPLIPVKWNQPSPYNKYCPSNSQGTALVGCVAVSMSQAMAVQQYPPQPQGKISYTCANYGLIKADLDGEERYDWDAIVKSDKNKNWDEAARLMYHAGISVSMDYGLDGSGIPASQVGRISKALVDNFAYDSKEVKYYWRANYSGDWNSLILNEINAGRAVVYNAQDREHGYGHSFNVDGYDANTKKFSVNWGWGGIGNGYFSLDNLSDIALNMNYNDGHVAVIGIGSPDRELRSIELSEYIIDEKLPAGTTVGLVTINGGETPADKYEIVCYGPYSKGQYQEVPFTIQDNRLVTTEPLTAQKDPMIVTIIVSDKTSSERLTSTFNISVVTLRTLGQATSMTYDRQTGEFKMKTRNNTEYVLTGANGTVIAQGSLIPVPQFSFNKSQLDNGENTLTISAGNETKVIVIKK